MEFTTYYQPTRIFLTDAGQRIRVIGVTDSELAVVADISADAIFLMNPIFCHPGDYTLQSTYLYAERQALVSCNRNVMMISKIASYR